MFVPAPMKAKASTATLKLQAAEVASSSDAHAETDDHAWGKRSEIWERRYQHGPKNGSMRERSRDPLILNGHEASLRVEGGTLLVRNGFTHYPQKQETHRVFRGQADRPERIILLDCSGSLSFDVLSWLSEQDISLVRVDWRGEVLCIASKSGYAANPYRVQWQRDTRADEHARMEFSISQITKKIENSILTLEKSVQKSATWNKAMEVAYSTLTKLDERQPKNIIELRVAEANAAAAYFRAWKGMPIRWRGTSKRPIPENWKVIGQRTSIFQRAGNRNASHPVNAMLNYAYTVLQSGIRIKAISEGYDPTIGIMHEGANGSAAFVFDFSRARTRAYGPQGSGLCQRTCF